MKSAIRWFEELKVPFDGDVTIQDIIFIQEDARTHYESALKEAKVALDACHAHTVHGEVMTRDECHLCKTLATINKVLGCHPTHHD